MYFIISILARKQIDVTHRLTFLSCTIVRRRSRCLMQEFWLMWTLINFFSAYLAHIYLLHYEGPGTDARVNGVTRSVLSNARVDRYIYILRPWTSIAEYLIIKQRPLTKRGLTEGYTAYYSSMPMLSNHSWTLTPRLTPCKLLYVRCNEEVHSSIFQWFVNQFSSYKVYTVNHWDRDSKCQGKSISHFTFVFV